MSTSPPPNLPKFTVISAVYNVSRYLPDYIRSIDAQTIDQSQLQIVMVDDGSTDDSLALVEEWAKRRPELVQVLTKQNGGQGSARNLGLTIARGDWVTFIDPDDWINDEYFEIFDRFSNNHPAATMMCSHRILFEEAAGQLNDNHPLKQMFKKDQLVSLRRYPEYFHGSVPAAFLQRQTIEDAELEFDTRIQPNFEDGHFCAKYLLLADDPQVGFVRSAEYFYRKRSDNSSTLANSVMQTGRFVEVPRYGYLDVLDTAIERKGKVPLWLQNMVLYELSWYFSSEDRPNNAASAADGEVGLQFVETLGEIARRLDVSAIESFSIRRYKPEWRDALLHSVRSSTTWHTDYVVLQQYDPVRREVRIAYRFSGPEPSVAYLIDDEPVEPTATKIRSHRYFGTDLLFERAAWVPHTGTLRVQLDGSDVTLATSWPATPKVTSLWQSQLRRKFFRPSPTALDGTRAAVATARKLAELLRDPQRLKRAIRTRIQRRFGSPLMRLLARSTPVRQRFESAWVLLDRLHDANDSAEILFRYLRTERPDVNAWFVLERGTADWERLKQDGVDRLVAVDSLRWKLLMLNCSELISSHADVPVMHPPEIMKYRPANWNFTFLQHGVIKDDLSKWLNTKRISTLVTSTVPEYESFVGDFTPYVFTTHEVKLTGLPRFDALYRAAQRTERPSTIIIAPTWRYWLNEPLTVGTQRRTVISDFSDTEFAQKWYELIHSPRLREIAEANGLDVIFMPHPNLEPAIPHFDVPGYMRLGSYSDPDLHALYGSALTLITDFSSTAFNTAFLGRQPIYYFFDHDLVMAGGHVGRKGYFDYQRDAFGPLIDQSDAVIDELEKLIANGSEPSEPYRSRIEHAFTIRDGRCCERVTAAIEANVAGR